MCTENFNEIKVPKRGNPMRPGYSSSSENEENKSSGDEAYTDLGTHK